MAKILVLTVSLLALSILLFTCVYAVAQNGRAGLQKLHPALVLTMFVLYVTGFLLFIIF